jgi:hypothetical protein
MNKQPLFWKELYLRPGDNIKDVAKVLVENAPAFCNFNGVRVEAHTFDTAGCVVKRYPFHQEVID